MQHSVFALELCARLDPGSALLATLRSSVKEQPHGVTLAQKWSAYRRASEALFHHLALAERGCWDFFDDDARARADFEGWSNGMIREEGVRTSPSGSGADPYRSTQRYLTFTMALLLIQGSPSERALARACDVSEDKLWRRETFATLLRGLGSVSFASVKADVMYLIPRDEGWGLTPEDLAHPQFNYLRPLA